MSFSPRIILKSPGLRVFALIVALVLFGVACNTDEPSGDDGFDDEYGVAVDDLDEFGKPTLDSTGWEEPAGKADAIQGRPGLLLDVDDTSTAVWEVRNQWTDRDTPAAREAGMAWPEDSGLSWDEKFNLWVDSLPRVDREGYGETFLLQTPHGVELPAPVLECAEVTIFLRVAFASWYHLPFFMEGRDSNGDRLYFGHFGIRTADGRYGRMANFRTAYEDHSSMADAITAGEAAWPSDPNLAGRRLPGARDDAQPMIGDDAYTGAYFDQVFLNKRVGYYLLMNLIYFGSINLADPVNTYHVLPESARAGDTLLHRWQRTGIGHVMVVMEVDSFGEGEEMQMEATVASGSMPRRQPLWETSASSKNQFTRERAGGPSYEDYNGGLKRWRVAAPVNGRWTNIVPDHDADNYVSATEKEALAARPARFQDLLTEIAAEDRLDAMAAIVEQAREHLRIYPASCVARDNRENAFDELYQTGDELGWTRAQIDEHYRELEDYIFAPLVYGESKTCCWNSTNAEMHRLIVDYNIDRMAEATDQCLAPVVFKARDGEGDGYDRFREFAEQVGKGSLWVDWSADENCPQVNGWAGDVEQAHQWTPWCELHQAVQGQEHSFTNDQGLAIPDNDPDGITSAIEVDIDGVVDAVSIDLMITHSYNGDLLVTLEKGDVRAVVYDGSGPGHDVILNDEELIEFQGIEARGSWELTVVDRMNLDEGDLEEWALHLQVR